MPDTVRFYEVVYIIPPDRSDEQIQAVVQKYSNIITSRGGSIERADIWERRRLAYEVKGYNEGIYVVVHFRGLPAIDAELKRVFRISEDTLRAIIVRPDEGIVASEPAPRLYRAETPAPEAPAPAPVVAPVVPAAAVEVEEVAVKVEEPVAVVEAEAPAVEAVAEEASAE